MKFTHTDSNGAEVCTLALFKCWGTVYGLQLFDKQGVDAQSHIDLLRRGSAAAWPLGARELMYRLIGSPRSLEVAAALPGLGFKKRHDRIEYRRELKDLPSDAGTPLTWKYPLLELNWSLQKLGAFVRAAAAGDPDIDPSEDPVVWMEDWLEEPVLTHGPQCISVGFLGSEPAAICVAQISPKSKWSRISYMAVIPDQRKMGLGKWVHRRGFEMMRAQGGELYHGGTVSTNTGMRRLFKLHGCVEHLHMEEWVARRPD